MFTDKIKAFTNFTSVTPRQLLWCKYKKLVDGDEQQVALKHFTAEEENATRWKDYCWFSLQTVNKPQRTRRRNRTSRLGLLPGNIKRHTDRSGFFFFSGSRTMCFKRASSLWLCNSDRLAPRHHQCYLVASLPECIINLSVVSYLHQKLWMTHNTLQLLFVLLH